MASTNPRRNDENRAFGLIMAGGLGTPALFRYVWAGSITVWLIALAGLAPVRAVWMKLAGVLGFVNSRILLTIVFALVITPIALLLRLLGKRPIGLGRQPGATSYWHRRDEQEFLPKRMERQF
ncbi:MAG: hypothetical protein C4293_17485 [Nitrospiraceae bacterium]